jgi:protein-N(Pi)-phosphohistidine--sugar phosphotransferase
MSKKANTFVIAERSYKAMRIGADANESPRAHGHVTLHFETEDTGADIQPGEILLIGSGFPQVMVDDTLEIL